MQKSMKYIKKKINLGKGKVGRNLLIQEKLNLKERSVGKECDCIGLRKSCLFYMYKILVIFM